MIRRSGQFVLQGHHRSLPLPSCPAFHDHWRQGWHRWGLNGHPDIQAATPAEIPVAGKRHERFLVAKHETEQIGHVILPH